MSLTLRTLTVPTVRGAVAGTVSRRRRTFDTTGLAFLDLGLLLVAFAVAHVARFPGELPAGSSGAGWIEFVVAPIMIVSWMLLLSVFRTRDPRIVGVGGDEYRRLITASLIAVGSVAVAAYAVQIDIARGYVAIAVPLTI